MSSETNTAYTDERQDKYFKLEEHSWWFVHRARLFKLLMNRYFEKKRMVFDIGGSNGFYSRAMQKAGYEITLVEPTASACQNARRRGVKNIVNSTFQDLDDDIPQFLLLDVLEHISDDTSFLRCLFEKMPQGGTGIIAVPAFMELWSSEDDVDGHYRRYYRESLLKLITMVGFKPLYYTYIFSFLWIPIFVVRHLGEKLGVSKNAAERTPSEDERVANREFKKPRGLAGVVLNLCMNLEYKMVKREKSICFGSSFVVLVRKV